MILSIIIPVFNVERYVERCLFSCINQDVSPNEYEIIIINDGSTDKSLEIVESIIKDKVNVTLFSQENKGLSAARNVGMQLAKGEYYFFVDSDDWIKQNCLSDIIKKLKLEKPDILALCSAVVSGDKCKRSYTFPSENKSAGKDSLKFNWSCTAQMSITRASFMKNNGFTFYEGIYHEDSELTPRMHYSAETMSYFNDVVYYFYMSEGSIMRSVNPKKAFDLVKVVCPRLHKFNMTIVESHYQKFFYNIISMYLNNALNAIMNCSTNDQKEFLRLLGENKVLLDNLWKSNIFKYKVENILFRLFSSKIIHLYRLFKRLQ